MSHSIFVTIAMGEAGKLGARAVEGRVVKEVFSASGESMDSVTLQNHKRGILQNASIS